MDTLKKLEILSTDSQYDLACACGTSDKDRRRRGLDGRWLYPVPLAAGGYGIMFKTLLSNACSNDCRYCPLRANANTARCTMTPEEAAAAFYQHTQKQWLLGMFLSSGVLGTPDRTMDRMLATADILRRRYRYRGYIHLKVIPGASENAIEEALRLASAVSLNIEVPGRKHFEKLSASKDFDRDIVHPLKFIAAKTAKGERYAKIKCTTQFIVGASDETDKEIVGYMDGIYNRLNFERVYFSAYQPGLGERSLPGENFRLDPNDRLTREHRLYQVDWLLRQYRFAPGELVYDDAGNLSLEADPKQVWAERHPEFFPVRVNSADKEALLRVPGLGPTSVEKIVMARRRSRIPRLSAIGLTGKVVAKAVPYLDFT